MRFYFTLYGCCEMNNIFQSDSALSEIGEYVVSSEKKISLALKLQLVDWLY